MRIVAGLAKGRRLTGPATGTRPTSDRTREAMFSTLAAMMSLDGARVLDLFAGTGAVGLEALSRGAQAAVFVENNRHALDVLRCNIEIVGLPGATVIARSVAQVATADAGGEFDLVFADPPYALADEKLRQLVEALLASGSIAPDGVVVIERSAHGAVGDWAHDCLTPVSEKRYGDSLLWYGRRR